MMDGGMEFFPNPPSNQQQFPNQMQVDPRFQPWLQNNVIIFRDTSTGIEYQYEQFLQFYLQMVMTSPALANLSQTSRPVPMPQAQSTSISTNYP